MRVWLDDLREAPSGWLWLTSSRSAINWLEWAKAMNVHPKVWSFDHDLGGSDTSRVVVLWMCENNWWPEACYIHSANPVGREWLAGMITRYGPGGTR